MIQAVIWEENLGGGSTQKDLWVLYLKNLIPSCSRKVTGRCGNSRLTDPEEIRQKSKQWRRGLQAALILRGPLSSAWPASLMEVTCLGDL